MSKVSEGFCSPKEGVELILRNVFPKILTDETYLRILTQLRFGHALDLKEPKTFNEKLNWQKLHDRNPQYTMMADKYEVKKIVGDIIGFEYVVPCYGVWSNFDEIDFDLLPLSFVLKCTHDSSGVIICKNKGDLDKKKAKEIVDRCLSKNNFWHSREWVYKDIKPRVLVDQYLDDGSGKELRDYKFWCFNGTPMIMYCTNKAADIFENFYDMDFNPLDISHGFKRQTPEFQKPKEFDLMKNLATKLSKDIPFVRVDFFDVNGHVYFGEYTFYDWAGLRPFKNEEMDMYLGSLIKLKK